MSAAPLDSMWYGSTDTWQTPSAVSAIRSSASSVSLSSHSSAVVIRRWLLSWRPAALAPSTASVSGVVVWLVWVRARSPNRVTGRAVGIASML